MDSPEELEGETPNKPPEKSSTSPAMDFIRDYLKDHNDATYAQVKSAAAVEGHEIYPIMYGRAKTLLGLISDDARQRRRRRREEDEDFGLRRPLRQGAAAPDRESTATQLSDFLERFQELEAQRNRFRAALLQVERILREALENTRGTP